MARSERMVPFGKGWHLYTRMVGTDDSLLPLLCLHGGPGAVSHDGLEPLELIAASGRRVIFFDQLGCGRSSRPDDPDLWSNALVREQIDAVRDAYSLTDTVVLGHSYGGWIVQEYALARPAGLRGIVLADTAPDADMYLAEGRRIRERLPVETREVMARHESAGTTDDSEYIAAYQRYLELFTCKLRPVPDSILRASAGGNSQISHVMWGPGGRSFEMDGRLQGWSVLDRLPEIATPTLVITGADDMASPRIARLMADAIPGARCEIIEGGSHTPFHEAPKAFCDHVSTFIGDLPA